MTSHNCPICGNPRRAGSGPFCSERCRLVDLTRWLSECYQVPIETERVLREAVLEPQTSPDNGQE